MGMLQRLAASILAKQAGTDPGTVVSMIRAGSRMGGRKTDPQAMLEAWQTSPWFRAVIERVSFAAAIVPWRLFAVKPESGSRAAKNGNRYVKHQAFQTGESNEVRAKIAKNLEASGRLEEIEEHKLFDLLGSPNEVLTGVDMRLVTFASLHVVGEIGWAIERGTLGEPEAIWPVPSPWITRVPDINYGFYDVQLGGTRRAFSEDEFILFRNPNIANPYARGSGLGASLADELETDEYIAKFQNTWFVNRGRPDIVFIAKPNKSGTMVDSDELERAKERFENSYRDVRRGGRSFWTRGDIDVKELDSKFVDLDLTEQRSWIKDLVRQVIGAPPEIMGDLTSSNRATITEAFAILAMICTVPQLERMRAQAQMKLMPMFDDRLALGYWNPVPEDREFKLRAVQAAPWTVEVGEMREMQGLDDRGDADRVHYIPMGMIPVPAPSRQKTGAEALLVQAEERRMLGAPVRKIAEAEIPHIVAALQPQQISAYLVPEVSETVEAWGNKALVDLGLAPSFSMTNPVVLEFLEVFAADKIVGINETTKAYVAEALRQGVEAGEGVPALAARVRESMAGASRFRSMAIARTETTGAANFGNYTAMAESGLVAVRAWVSTMDDLTRDGSSGAADHLSMDGMEVPISEPFIGGTGAQALYPGDFGVAEEDINCRCAIRAVIEGKAYDKTEFVKTFLEETANDERRTARAVVKAFEEQIDILIEALEAA